MQIAVFFLGVFWVVECFNEKWLHYHQLESYSKKRKKIKICFKSGPAQEVSQGVVFLPVLAMFKKILVWLSTV
jgi:hypothetical protein